MTIQKALYYIPDIFLLVVFPALAIMSLPLKNNDAIFILGFITLLWIAVSSVWLKWKIEILGEPILLGESYSRKFFTKNGSTSQLVRKRA